jgi:chromosome segregation ATPase
MMIDYKELIDKPTEELKALRSSLADERQGAEAELRDVKSELSMLAIDLNLSKARRESATTDQAYQAAAAKIDELQPKILVRENRVRLLTEQLAGITRGQALITFELERQQICADGAEVDQAYKEFRALYVQYWAAARRFHNGYSNNLARLKSFENRADNLGLTPHDYHTHVGGPGGISPVWDQWQRDLALDGLR